MDYAKVFGQIFGQIFGRIVFGKNLKHLALNIIFGYIPNIRLFVDYLAIFYNFFDTFLSSDYLKFYLERQLNASHAGEISPILVVIPIVVTQYRVIHLL